MFWGLALLIVAWLLVYSGFKGVSPKAELSYAFSGGSNVTKKP